MKLPTNISKRTLLALVLLSFVLLPFVLGLASFPIYIVDEARNSQAAWEMYESGNYVVPYFAGGLRADKPPLHYYGMQMGYALFGKTPLGARLGSLLCALACLLVLFVVGQKYFSKSGGWITVVVYGVGLYVPLQFHLATPDPYLAFFFLAGMLALYHGFVNNQQWYLYVGYCCIGLATLAKGPVALFLAAASWLVFISIEQSAFWESIKRLRLLQGIVIFLLVVVPWFWKVHLATEGAFTEEFFLGHNVDRFLNVKEGHKGFWGFIFFIVFVGLLPFGGWALYKIKRRWEEDVFIRYLAIVSGVILLFFSVSQTQLPSYPFPAFGFIALLAADGIRFRWNTARAQNSISSALIFSSASLVFCLIPLGICVGLEKDPVLYTLSNAWPLFLPSSILAMLGMYVFVQSTAQKAMYVVGVAAIVNQLVLMGWGLPALSQFNQVAASVPLLKSAPEIVAYGRFSPAYIFELNDCINQVRNPQELEDYLKASGGGALIITAERYKDQLVETTNLTEVFRQKDLFEYPTTIIYRYDEGQ